MYIYIYACVCLTDYETFLHTKYRWTDDPALVKHAFLGGKMNGSWFILTTNGEDQRMNYQPAISHISLNASLSQFNKFIHTHIILQERSKGWVNMAGKSPNQIP